MNAKSILQSLENKKVLIVGDVMLDRYMTGSVSRISPEAPVPIVLHKNTEDRLGGAANVALNIRALGSMPLLCSIVGDDPAGVLFEEILQQEQISATGIIRSTQRKTTLKTRIIGNNQQMLRVDSEDTHDLNTEETEQLLSVIRTITDREQVDIIILQDYNKGVLSATVIEQVLALAQQRNIPTAVDPKKNNFLNFKGVTLFKPNLKEVRDSLPFQIAPNAVDLQQASLFLNEHLNNAFTMITLSEKGIFIADQTEAGQIYPTIPRTIADVSGAGDTVISVASLALAAGLDQPLIALLSNLAGGQVCEHPGVVSVQRAVLQEELTQYINSI